MRNKAGEYLWANKKEEIFYDKQKKAHFMNHMFQYKKLQFKKHWMQHSYKGTGTEMGKTLQYKNCIYI